ncbi:DUF1853 family protein [Lacinutrix sp. Bg11-31]|uniref:DUF1853 family protein n=1 Tax=Lacinutrix sp. Bg11-31 TaxID=2057808 RepID=UPI000C3065AC|nr:DUF1853 family protein [Lacinutrix sp. Bg11-31]AUC81484.1 DUF1853 domain-containing protein [Lacinutrix sp. Bg11-31]
MKNISDNLQAQFSGFYNTPHLLLEPVLGMQSLITLKQNMPIFEGLGLEKIRLGQRVERFVGTELRLNKNIKILSENPQIQTENNLTIGELDCLYLEGEQPVHLEIQFKFYLYDESLGKTEIDHCIGPMRRDSLIEKLTKLKKKQLPLLYANETKPLLNSLNLKAEDFIQKIYFKAQVFVPYGKTIQLKTLNSKCIYGFYFKYAQISKFIECKFYKPKKTDWLLDVTPNVDWKTYDAILPELNIYETEGYSPMLWLKQENGEIEKCFVVC